jgi:hypothetical protein
MAIAGAASVPRTRGDEPAEELAGIEGKRRSPHARGFDRDDKHFHCIEAIHDEFASGGERAKAAGHGRLNSDEAMPVRRHSSTTVAAIYTGEF